MPCCRRANYLVSLLTYRLSSTPHPCNLFGIDFNVIAKIFSTNSTPDRKQSILAKVCFVAKRGWPANATKRIFITSSRHLYLF